MSTRNIIKVRSAGQLKVCQFVQSDGYPTMRGKEVLEFVRSFLADNKESDFREKINASTSVITPPPNIPRFDFAIVGRDFKPSKKTFTGAPITPRLSEMLKMVNDTRIDMTNGTVTPWYDAMKNLYVKGDIAETEVGQLVVASRDSGIGCLRWLLYRCNGITFYMPEDLVCIPDGGGLSKAGDSILGVYTIDLDKRIVVCGFHGIVQEFTFSDVIGMSNKRIGDEMGDLETRGDLNFISRRDSHET